MRTQMSGVGRSGNGVDYRTIRIPFHDYLGFRLEVDGSPSRVVQPLGDHVRGSVAPLHGGVLCPLLDMACGSAVGQR